MSDISGVKALVFDVFGTVVDWRTSLINDFTKWSKTRGIEADWTALVDGWRAVYAASMDVVRKNPQAGYVILDTEEKRARAAKMGVNDPKLIYGIEDMAKGDCLFAATGVTTGSLLSGVKFRKDGVIETETVVMRSVTGTVRYIKAEHRQLEKFHLD